MRKKEKGERIMRAKLEGDGKENDYQTSNN